MEIMDYSYTLDGGISEVLLVKRESCRKVYIMILYSKTHHTSIYVIGNTNICIRLYKQRDKYGTVYNIMLFTQIQDRVGIILIQREGKVQSQAKKNGIGG